MARQTNIVSFDDAKTKSRRSGAAQTQSRSRRATAAEPNARRTRGGGASAGSRGADDDFVLNSEWFDRVFDSPDDGYDDFDDYAAPSSRRGSTRAASTSRTSRQSSSRNRDSRSNSASSSSSRTNRQASASSSSRRASHQASTSSGSRRASSHGAAPANARGTRGANRGSSAANDRGIGLIGAFGNPRNAKHASSEKDSRRRSQNRAAAAAEDRRPASESKREARRRERTKARADKMFDKQFVAERGASGAQDEGPRAALYEGKMGATHRRSSRMQRAADAGSEFAARFNPAAWLAGLPITARSLRIATAALCIVLVCVSMYTPAQQYYQAQRDHDRLAAEYSIIADRNETLDVQNDVLASDAGMEDAVRQKYGYIKAGEQSAVVTGLSAQATDSNLGSESLEPAILSSSVKAPVEWYTPFLDAFFGIDYGDTLPQ